MTEATCDDDLKRLAHRNRGAALDLLARRHERSLLAHANTIVHDGEEAADLVQETLVRALREPRLFDADFQTRAWLHRVLANLSYNRSRDRRRRSNILENTLRYEPRAEELADRTEVSQRSDAFATVLSNLRPAHRQILQLRYWQDLSYAEIATVLQVRMGTVMSRLSRARDQFHLHAPPQPEGQIRA